MGIVVAIRGKSEIGGLLHATTPEAENTKREEIERILALVLGYFCIWKFLKIFGYILVIFATRRTRVRLEQVRRSFPANPIIATERREPLQSTISLHVFQKLNMSLIE